MKSRRVKHVSSYLGFTFEPLHNLYPALSKSVNECTINYLSCGRLKTGKVQKITILFARIQVRIALDRNLSLSGIKRDEELPGTHIQNLKKEASNGWNGLRTKTVLSGMQESNDDQALEIVFKS